MRAIRMTLATAMLTIGILVVPPVEQGAFLRAGAASSSAALVERQFKAFEAAIGKATAQAQQWQYTTTAQDKFDAVSYIRQLAQLNLDTQLLALDPNHPTFFRDPDPFSVPGANPPVRSGIYDPDNISYIAIVNGTDQYRITGKRGNSDDVSVQAISGFPGAGSTGAPTATLLRNQIKVSSDGSYTINVGWPSQSGNWLPTVAQTTLISVREAFNNWSRAVADQLSIQTVGQTGTAPARLTNQKLAAAIEAATNAVTQQGSYWTTLWGSLLSSLPANQIRTPAPTQGGLAGQLSSLSHFDLSNGQALVVSVGKSDALYQGFEAADAFAQSLPYATHESSLNATQAQLASDGRYYFVVAAKDPGVPNWIDTEGYNEGFLFLRWQELTGALPAADNPTSQVVPLASVRSVLPAATPTVTPSQRKAQLAARDKAVARRVRSSSNEAQRLLTVYLRQLASAVGRGPVLSIYAGTSLRSRL
jgi:hypothetical protein